LNVRNLVRKKHVRNTNSLNVNTELPARPAGGVSVSLKEIIKLKKDAEMNSATLKLLSYKFSTQIIKTHIVAT